MANTDSTDQHLHRNPDTTAEPFDAVNQSLSDALRSSFSVLKGIMVVLVVLYLFSNVRSIAGHEQALKLRLGRLLPGTHEAGLVWALPSPIDEIVPLPTLKSNELLIGSHTFYRRSNEIGKPLTFISRNESQGLNPSLDGALLTADTGLVHTQWKVTYKFDNVRNFVTGIAGDGIDAAETLITTYVETVGIEIASELTADEFIRTELGQVQSEMRRRINQRLVAIESGVVVTLVEMFEPTPPIQIRKYFDGTQRAENRKRQKIRAAEQERTTVLSETAGGAYASLVKLLDEIEKAEGDETQVARLREKLDRMLDSQVEGVAGRRIKQAGAYRALVVTRMEADVERYKTLLPEYKRNPMLLINRLWEETKQLVFANPGVTKFYLPPGYQFRLKISLDPNQARDQEKRRLSEKEFDRQLVRPDRYVPIGWEYD